MTKSGGTTPERVRQEREVLPPVDVYENSDEILVLADVPGADAESIQVNLDPPELRFEARPKPLNGNGESSFVYTRAFRVNEQIDANGISAELKNGVLYIRLRKAEAVKPRKIVVKAS
jgi:HSP20 family molecular chaperone IbpA